MCDHACSSSASASTGPSFVGYTVIVISLLFVYFGIRSYRDNVLGGRITFGTGFQAGILITLISCVFYVGAWLVIYYGFMPDFADQYAAYTVEDMRADGASQAEIERSIKEGEDMRQMLDNPFTNAAVTFIEPFPVGLLITLISAAVLKNRRRRNHAARSLFNQPDREGHQGLKGLLREARVHELGGTSIRTGSS